jgi:hypothetical protein
MSDIGAPPFHGMVGELAIERRLSERKLRIG